MICFFRRGNIERWSVVGKYLLFLFLFPLAFFLGQVFWPCGIVFVMKLSQVQARIAYVQGNLGTRLIIFEIFLEQLQNLVFLVFFFVIISVSWGLFSSFCFSFLVFLSLIFAFFRGMQAIFCTVLMIFNFEQLILVKSHQNAFFS